MAELVEVMCVPHDPTMPGRARRGGDMPASVRETHEAFGHLRQRLDQARADVLIVVSGDHFNQWFMDNMPQFLVGKAPRAAGPFLHEQRLFGISPYDVELEGALARHLLDRGLERHIDFAYSNEFTLDHGFTVPLEMLRPQQDLPVVPLFTNVMAPPVPPGRRFHELGQSVRQLVEGFDAGVRVAVIASGHMSNSVGGPQMLSIAENPLSDWDRQTWEHLHTGDMSSLVDACTYDALSAVGNGTPGFLDYVFALGLVGDARPDWSALASGPTHPPAGFLAWGEPSLMGGAR